MSRRATGTVTAIVAVGIMLNLIVALTSAVFVAVRGQQLLSFTGLMSTWPVIIGFPSVSIAMAIAFPPRTSTDTTGTTFRPAHQYGRWQVFMIGYLATLAGASLTLWLWQLPKLVTTSFVGQLVSFFWGVTFPVVLLAVVTPLAWARIRWHAAWYLRLTPTGGEFSSGARLHTFVWEHVSDIAGFGGGGTRGSSAAPAVAQDGSRRTLKGGAFAYGGPALLDLVRFYWRSPMFRDELTNGGAEARLREMLSRR